MRERERSGETEQGRGRAELLSVRSSRGEKGRTELVEKGRAEARWSRARRRRQSKEQRRGGGREAAVPLAALTCTRCTVRRSHQRLREFGQRPDRRGLQREGGDDRWSQPGGERERPDRRSRSGFTVRKPQSNGRKGQF